MLNLFSFSLIDISGISVNFEFLQSYKESKVDITAASSDTGSKRHFELAFLKEMSSRELFQVVFRNTSKSTLDVSIFSISRLRGPKSSIEAVEEVTSNHPVGRNSTIDCEVKLLTDVEVDIVFVIRKVRNHKRSLSALTYRRLAGERNFYRYRKQNNLSDNDYQELLRASKSLDSIRMPFPENNSKVSRFISEINRECKFEFSHSRSPYSIPFLGVNLDSFTNYTLLKDYEDGLEILSTEPIVAGNVSLISKFVVVDHNRGILYHRNYLEDGSGSKVKFYFVSNTSSIVSRVEGQVLLYAMSAANSESIKKLSDEVAILKAQQKSNRLDS
jgi:hypothetical protein